MIYEISVKKSDLAKLVNGTVRMAKKKYSMTCGMVEYNEEYAELVKEKALNGVKFIIISGRTAKFKKHGEKAYNPLLDLLDKGGKDMRIYNNLNLFYKNDGWPILHYIAFDDETVLVESCHRESYGIRNISLFGDRKTISALHSKTHYDIGLPNIIQASRSSDYMDHHLISASEESQRNAELEFARTDPFGWIRRAVQEEIKNYGIREANFKELTKGYVKPEKIKEFTKILRKNLDKLTPLLEGSEA